MCLELLKHQERSNIVNFLSVNMQGQFHRLQNTKQGKAVVFSWCNLNCNMEAAANAFGC